ncbi:MAG: DUF2854 domain-containing protein [Elainellaceae cyanobacterium]
MLPRISLGSLGLTVGGVLTVVGFIAYFIDNPTLNLAGFFYGVPILLGGFALKAAELKPVAVDPPTSDEVLALRKQQATPTQDQVRKDVTRYRYGQEAHLDIALERLGLSPTDDERPMLTSIRETQVDGAYALILVFYSPLIDAQVWQEKREKLETFFGPAIRAEVEPFDEEMIKVSLIRDATQSVEAVVEEQAA